jgi:ferrous iron transport protein B
MKENSKILYLSDLKNGETAWIIKVKGYGAFRKRITEMGFVPGTKVKSIKNAPFQDPVEYEVMGYRISLRKSEASQIEIVRKEDNSFRDQHEFKGIVERINDRNENSEKEISLSKQIDVVLVGNPNSGKTSLFNHTTGKHEHVGNYGGVTVDIKTAFYKKNGYKFNITDLPGTYSLSEYTPEELFVRKHLTNTTPDVVINVVDSSNLERNLFLTTQLIDMDFKVVIALNMYDELQKKGNKFDYELFGKMLGIPVIPTVASTGKGLDELFDKVIEVYKDKDSDYRHVHINFGNTINDYLNEIKAEIKKNQQLMDIYHSHYVAVKLLENDQEFIKTISKIQGTEELIEHSKKISGKLEDEFKEKAETVIVNARYGFIKGALKETYKPNEKENNKKGIDYLLTHKWFGFPIFLFFMWLMFQLTFTIGQYPMDWIENGVELLNGFLMNNMEEGMLRDLITDGIISGVGGVLVFLPNILILFFFISLMEDTGYMARTAFIMDKLMHKIGLHGKSFIPLLMGIGCNVPAIMATRTIENRQDRILTILITPFMSCSARLPVYTMLISAFFVKYQGLILFSIYLLGIVLAVISSLVFKKIFFKKKEAPFVMEMPPYRLPTMKNTLIHMWEKSKQYLSKMGSVILVASVIIWVLMYFPRNVEFSKNYDFAIENVEANVMMDDQEKEILIKNIELEQEAERTEKSYIGKIGHFIEPVMRPLGFDWKISVSLVSGLAAKEIVVSTMSVLYQSHDEEVGLQEKLKQQTYNYGPKKGEKVFTPLVAFTMMIFILIYFPCIAVIAAIKKEAGIKWAVFTVFYTTGLAWLVSFLIYTVGNLII